MKKYLSLLVVLAITSSASSNIFTNIKINPDINISQKFLQKQNLNDWSDNGYDFKIAKERYVLNLNSLPRNIIDQIQNDKRNNQKSFSEDALDLKYLNDEQRKDFFWVQDNQIQNSKGEIVKWWDKDDKHFGTKISVTNQQIDQVKNALTYEKKKLQDGGWYQTKSSKSSWNFYKEKLGHFLDVTKITDGDTMKFSGLTGLNLLEPSSTKTVAPSDNVRALVMDTDETLWSRYNSHKNEENADKYLPTRLGYVQKAVAQIAGEIYQNQKWLIVPISADKYNRTLSLIFTPDGIPWHKFLCECYCAGIYKNENQIPTFKIRNNYLMIQWWIIDFWLDRASIILTPDEKGYKTGDISNNKILFEVDKRDFAHNWIKVKISYDIFLNMINIYKTKNYSEMQNYFYIIIQSFPRLDNTAAGGSILQSDIEMAVKIICDNFLEISNFYENQELSKGLLIVTNRIGSWDKNDYMGVFSQ